MPACLPRRICGRRACEGLSLHTLGQRGLRKATFSILYRYPFRHVLLHLRALGLQEAHEPSGLWSR